MRKARLMKLVSVLMTAAVSVMAGCTPAQQMRLQLKLIKDQQAKTVLAEAAAAAGGIERFAKVQTIFAPAIGADYDPAGVPSYSEQHYQIHPQSPRSAAVAMDLPEGALLCKWNELLNFYQITLNGKRLKDKALANAVKLKLRAARLALTSPFWLLNSNVKVKYLGTETFRSWSYHRLQASDGTGTYQLWFDCQSKRLKMVRLNWPAANGKDRTVVIHLQRYRQADGLFYASEVQIVSCDRKGRPTLNKLFSISFIPARTATED